jgi:DNA-binding HxlR family transcriptional regulator
MKKITSTNALNQEALTIKCPLLFAMEQLNGRWKILLIWYIHLGLNRFGLIRKQLPNLTTKMLSQQIKELEADGLLIRTIYPEMPPRVEYTLTAKALSLIPIFEQLNQWGVVEKSKT